MTTQTLVSFIRSHGHVASVAADGSILAEAVSTRAGQVFTQLETVQPTLAAVRFWLGY